MVGEEATGHVTMDSDSASESAYEPPQRQMPAALVVALALQLVGSFLIRIVLADLEQRRPFDGEDSFRAATERWELLGRVLPFACLVLALAGVSPRTEVQLLKYRHPDPLPDAAIGNLTKLGFNHICFAVDDLEAEVARLKANGVKLRNEVMDFHNRKLVFLSGPEGITVELAEWERSRG